MDDAKEEQAKCKDEVASLYRQLQRVRKHFFYCNIFHFFNLWNIFLIRKEKNVMRQLKLSKKKWRKREYVSAS